MRAETVGWVESPLQLLGALEHAELNPAMSLTIFPRGGDAQLENTAAHVAHLLGATGVSRVAVAVDRRFVPARAFAPDAAWLVGDPYSGQVQVRLDRAEPRTLALVDDGAITRLFAEQLHAGEPLMRPRPPKVFASFRRELASRTTRRLRRMAYEGRLTVTTYLDQDDPAVALLRDVGVAVVTHRFDATRRIGLRAATVPHGARVVLGSAAVVDGLTDPATALRRLERLAGGGRPVAYLPHRREPQWFLTAAARISGVAVVAAQLPIELALAGVERPLEVIAPLSSAAETLPVVLRGTGSIVHPAPVTRGAER